MAEIPIKVTGTLNVIAICSECHEKLEATIIIDNEKNVVVVSLDTNHICTEKPIKKKPALN